VWDRHIHTESPGARDTGEQGRAKDRANPGGLISNFEAEGVGFPQQRDAGGGEVGVQVQKDRS